MTTIQDRAIQLLEYRLTLGMTTMEGRGVYHPTDTAIAADGRMYVANRSLENVTRGVRVTMCDIDSEYYGTFGAYGVSAGQFIWPSTCTLDSRGRVYVSDEQLHRISVFDREGALLSTWGEHGAGEGQMDTPSGLAFDAELFPEVDGESWPIWQEGLSEALVDEPWLMIVNGVLKGLLGKSTTCRRIPYNVCSEFRMYTLTMETRLS